MAGVEAPLNRLCTRGFRGRGIGAPTASSKLQLCRNYRTERIAGRRMRDTIVRGSLVSSRAPFHRVRPCRGVTTSAMITSSDKVARHWSSFPSFSYPVYLSLFFRCHPLTLLPSLCRAKPCIPFASRSILWARFGFISPYFFTSPVL